MLALSRRLPLIAFLLLGLSLIASTASASSHSALANQARHKALSRSRAHLAGATDELLLPRAFDSSAVPMPVERRGTFAKRRVVRRACSAASSSLSPLAPSGAGPSLAISSSSASTSSASVSASVPSASASVSVGQGDDGISTVEVTVTSTRQTTIYASPSATAAAASSSTAATATVSTVDRAGAGPFQGDATWFATGLGACGWVNTREDNIVAVSSLLFDSWPGYSGGNPNNNPICNKRIRVSLPSSGTSIEVTVADRCVGCSERDLDLTELAFERLVPGGVDVGRVGMTWAWI